MNTIGLIGKKGSGKSYAADLIAQEFGYRHFAFADKLKNTNEAAS